MAQSFVSCDWGTSTLRLRLVTANPFRIVATVRSDDGAAAVRERIGRERLEPAAAFATTLARALGELESLCRARGAELGREAPVLISGMASSTIGWKELPYARVPVLLDGRGIPWAEVAFAGRRVVLISGLRTDGDVLRGEETEVIGLLAEPAHAAFREQGVAILPGTHSKHVRLERGAIVDFTTYMTGELFAVLARRSILQHSVELAAPPAGSEEAGRVDEALEQGARAARSKTLSAALFSVRTNQVLHGLQPTLNAQYLSGLLIGTEALEVVEKLPPQVPILLAAGPQLARQYELAFAALGLKTRLTVASPERVDSAAARGQGVMLEAMGVVEK